MATRDNTKASKEDLYNLYPPARNIFASNKNIDTDITIGLDENIIHLIDMGDYVTYVLRSGHILQLLKRAKRKDAVQNIVSYMDVRDPYTIQVHDYSKFISLSFILAPDKLGKATVLGGGGGTVLKNVKYYYPEVDIKAVDIDSSVCSIAESHFKVPEGHMVCGDAFSYIKEIDNQDLITLDIYDEEGFIPGIFLEKNFFNDIGKALSDKGVFCFYIVDYPGTFESPKALEDLLEGSFDNYKVFTFSDIWDDALVIGYQGEEVDEDYIRARAKKLQDSKNFRYDINNLVGKLIN